MSTLKGNWGTRHGRNRRCYIYRSEKLIAKVFQSPYYESSENEFMLKVVSYWLAKLLDPHHDVVLSHEHQDFKVDLFVKSLVLPFDVMMNQLNNQICFSLVYVVLLYFFYHSCLSVSVGRLWECLSACEGVPRYAAIASEVSGRPRKRQMIPNKHKMVFTHAIFQSQWLGQQTQQPSIYNRSKDRPKH